MESNREDAKRCIEIAARELAAGDQAKALKFARKAQALYPSPEADSMVAQATCAPSSAAGAKASTASSSSATGASAGAKRPATGAPGATSSGNSGTPEQRESIKKILGTSSYYDILGVPRNASEEDIKKAYRKLALKLHPDKCKAPQAEEAFKKVSRSFGALGNAQKRAEYDRYGSTEEQQGLRQRRPGGGGGFREEDIDPFEVFNMFFGGAGPMGGMGPGVRFHYAGGGSPFSMNGRTTNFHQRHHQQQQQPNPDPRRNLFQLLPLLMLFFFTFWPNTNDPVYSLNRDTNFPEQLKTKSHDVKFYVNSRRDFEVKFPPSSEQRYRLEQRVEYEYRDFLHTRCQHERKRQRQVNTWDREKARTMELKHCDELAKKWKGNAGYVY